MLVSKMESVFFFFFNHHEKAREERAPELSWWNTLPSPKYSKIHISLKNEQQYMVTVKLYNVVKDSESMP